MRLDKHAQPITVVCTGMDGPSIYEYGEHFLGDGDLLALCTVGFKFVIIQFIDPEDYPEGDNGTFSRN